MEKERFRALGRYRKLMRNWPKPSTTKLWDIVLPDSLSSELLSNLNLQNRKVGVIINFELVTYLLEAGIPADRIVYFSDCNGREMLAESVGLSPSNICQISAVTAKDINIDMPNFQVDVVLTNPPYMESKGTGATLYNRILERMLDAEPAEIAVVCPRAFFVSSKMRKIRERLLATYHIKMVRFLNETLDWDGQDLGIHTLAFVAVKGKSNDLTRVYPEGSNTPYTHDFNQFPELIDFGADARLAKLILKHQTRDKFKLTRFDTDTAKKLARVIGPTVAQISSKGGKSGSYTVIDQGEGLLSSVTGYKVVIGVQRTSSVVVVPPGIAIPGKYAFMQFETEAEAERVRAYLMTSFIRYIAKQNRDSNSVSSAQIKFLPKIDLDSLDEITDASINNYFGIDESLASIIEAQIGDHNPY